MAYCHFTLNLTLVTLPVAQGGQTTPEHVGHPPHCLHLVVWGKMEPPSHLPFPPDGFFWSQLVHFFTCLAINSDSLKMQIQVVNLGGLVDSCDSSIQALYFHSIVFEVWWRCPLRVTFWQI